MDKSEALLTLKGKHFDESGTSLHDLLVAYEAFEGILDTTFATAAGIKRFTPVVREQYHVFIKETKRASWDTVFEIVLAVSPVLFGKAMTGVDLLSTAKATYDFCKHVFSLKQEKKEYQINNFQDGRIQVVESGGTQVNFNAPVHINIGANAAGMIPEIRKLTNLMEKDSLSEVGIDGPDGGKIISLSKHESDLFSLVPQEAEETFEIECEIYRYNKRSRTGRLQVLELQEIPSGNYTFKVTKQEIQDNLIISMIKRRTAISVQTFIENDPISNTERIDYLEILSVPVI